MFQKAMQCLIINVTLNSEVSHQYLWKNVLVCQVSQNYVEKKCLAATGQIVDDKIYIYKDFIFVCDILFKHTQIVGRAADQAVRNRDPQSGYLGLNPSQDNF